MPSHPDQVVVTSYYPEFVKLVPMDRVLVPDSAILGVGVGDGLTAKHLIVYSSNHNVSTSQILFGSNIIVNLCHWVLIDYRHYMTGTRRSVRLDAATTYYDQARLSTIASKVPPPLIKSG